MIVVKEKDWFHLALKIGYILEYVLLLEPLNYKYVINGLMFAGLKVTLYVLKKLSSDQLKFAIFIVLTMIGISNSNKTCYQNGCQSRTNACI